MNKKKIFLHVIIFSMMTMRAWSQTTDLDPVIVSASLVQQKISKTGRDIIVINSNKLKQLPIHSIDELLRYLPGIEIQQRGPQGTQADILLRGGTFQQVLVILDGIRLNDPLTGHFNAYIPISTTEIERIEIVKGASSAIYGSDAVGGVINIISKTFAAKKGNEAMAMAAQFTVGEYGLINGNAGGNWQHANTAIAAGIVTNNATGQQQRGIKGFFHNTTVSGSLKQFVGNNWTVALRSAYDNRDFAAQNFYTAFTSDTATEKVTSWWNHVQVNYQKEKNSFSFDAGYKQARDEYHFTKASSPNLNNSSIFQSLAKYTRHFDDATAVTGGVQFFDNAIRSNDRGGHSVKQVGVFVILDQKFFRALNIHPALRTDWNERAGWELIPQLSVSYRLKKFVFRGMIGKSTRNADFTERYNNYNKTFVSSGNIGNPGLRPEYSLSYEAGADYFLCKAIKLSATYFRKDYDDLIDWVNTPYAEMPRKDNLSPSGNYYLAKNESTVISSGFEFDLQYNKEWNNDQNLYATAGLLWLNSKSNGQEPSLYISSHADFLFNYSLIYRYHFFELSINGLYKQRPQQAGNASLAQLSKEYYVMNARLAGAILPGKVSLFIEADNLLDNQYADRFGVPMPGRWWMAGIKFSFKKN